MGHVHTSGTSQAQRAITFGEDDAIVVDFLVELSRAMTSGDLDKLTTMWEAPALAIGDDIENLLASKEDVRAFFAGSKEMYAERGIVYTRPDLERIEWASDKLVIADVRWPYLDADGDEVGEERSTYVLKIDDDDRPTIRFALMRGETS